MPYLNDDLERLIDQRIHSERDRKILKRRLIDGVLFKELEKEFGYSERHIKRIVYKAQNILFKHFEP